jgi:hypothetical protein
MKNTLFISALVGAVSALHIPHHLKPVQDVVGDSPDVK